MDNQGSITQTLFSNQKIEQKQKSSKQLVTANQLERALDLYFKRKEEGGILLSSLPLDLNIGTPFQKEVWGALREIPWGETLTYAQVGAAIGRPRAYQAIGQACSKNPFPLIWPCHRVVGKTAGVGGFTALGRRDEFNLKLSLLENESLG